jgi:class 3 adenylate cyclase
MQPPETHYARRPDGVSIGYQVVGEGGVDMVVSPGFVSHLDLFWSDPGYARFIGQLSTFARVMIYDKPGTGVSDPIPHVPAVEERADDIRILLDEVGWDSAAIFGISEGGPAAAMFAATYPLRTRALVIFGSFARIDSSVPGYEEMTRKVDDLLEHWGDGNRLADVFIPSATALQRRFLGTFARAAASPGMARAVMDVVFSIDVSAALPLIHAPTLVLHRRDDSAVPVKAGAWIAEGIEGARFVELSGIDHVPWAGDIDAITAEVAEFLTGAPRVAEPDRVLATVLFTDIVGSTERAAALGDARWRELLGRHDAICAQQVREHGGRVVKSLGDGMLATFAGPAQAVRCAQALIDELAGLEVDLRAGVHTGEIEVIGEDVGGMAVHLGARVSATASAGEVLVSSTVRDLVVGSDLQFAEAGEHELKGIPGAWRLYRLQTGAPPREPLQTARDNMKLRDRVAVAMARRAPSAARLAGRVAARAGAQPR